MSGTGSVSVGDSQSPEFHFSLTTCVEPSCLDTRNAAPVLTPTGCPVSSSQSVSPWFPVTKPPQTRRTQLPPKHGECWPWGREPSSCCSRAPWSSRRPGPVSAGSGGNGLCGEGRGDRPGVGGGAQDPQGRSDPAVSSQTCPLPPSRPVPSLLPSPPSPGPSATFSVSRDPRPSLPSRPRHLGPGTRAGRRSGRVSHRPAPRLPLPEVFPHRRVPARPRGAPLHHRRLRGRHAVRAVRQRRPESEDGAAGAVGGAGGARVLGSGDDEG